AVGVAAAAAGGGVVSATASPIGAGRPGGAGSSPDGTVLDAFFSRFYRRRPVTATFTGIHDHDHALPDFSPEGMQSARDEMCVMRRDLAEAGYGVLHSDEIRRRDWAAI